MGIGRPIKMLLVILILTMFIYFLVFYFPDLYDAFKTRFMDKAVPST
ncbi:MAG: hypothetical protein QGG50_07300 [Methanopyri archaeon]|jgi:hypothetical protein|nr:hypothetical protein [Methanopyri archaeon]